MQRQGFQVIELPVYNQDVRKIPQHQNFDLDLLRFWQTAE